MIRNRQVNHFFLTDKPRDIKYRFSYDKEFTVKEKLKWRERWLKGEISLECACGKRFAINRAGSIYYPAGDGETKPHSNFCKRGKSSSHIATGHGKTNEKWIVLHVPEMPLPMTQRFETGKEERLLAQRLVEPYPMTNTGSLKHKTGKKWVNVNGKETHMNRLLVETVAEFKSKKSECRYSISDTPHCLI